MGALDTDGLERSGYIVIERLLQRKEIEDFEAAIARFSEAQIRALGLARQAPEAFIDVFARGGSYAARIYQLMERLFVLHRISSRIGDLLEDSGFLDWAGIEVPLIWPDIRADIPNDSARTLPVHQDFASMQCQRAWRLWIPLRPASAATGSMIVYPGTHKRGPVPHSLKDPLKPCVEPSHYAGVEGVVIDLPAGDAVLMNPLLFHASVPNRSQRTKFTLMVQVQDYATVIDPDNDGDALADFHRITAERTRARVRAAG
jgi:ectoine hydroxylase-related dioxygenase (phytanoyl-CoA dioxygenase family)